MYNFNQNQNQGFYGMGAMGTSYANVQQPKMTQPLNKEEMEQLKQNSSAFSLNLTAMEVAKGICMHKENGAIPLSENPDGSVTCPICNETFFLINKSQEEIEALTAEMLNVLQTVKTYYLDMPVNAAREFFKIIPMITKIPHLYSIASNNFRKHENANMFNSNNQPYGFNMYNNIVGGGMMNGMMPNQGMMNNGMMPNQGMMNNGMMPNQGMMNNGMMPNQGMMNNGMNMAQDPNPFYSTGAQIGQPTQDAFYNNQPQGMQQQGTVAQGAKATNGTVVQTKQMDI